MTNALKASVQVGTGMFMVLALAAMTGCNDQDPEKTAFLEYIKPKQRAIESLCVDKVYYSVEVMRDQHAKTKTIVSAGKFLIQTCAFSGPESIVTEAFARRCLTNADSEIPGPDTAPAKPSVYGSNNEYAFDLVRINGRYELTGIALHDSACVQSPCFPAMQFSGLTGTPLWDLEQCRNLDVMFFGPVKDVVTGDDKLILELLVRQDFGRFRKGSQMRLYLNPELGLVERLETPEENSTQPHQVYLMSYNTESGRSALDSISSHLSESPERFSKLGPATCSQYYIVKNDNEPIPDAAFRLVSFGIVEPSVIRRSSVLWRAVCWLGGVCVILAGAVLFVKRRSRFSRNG